MRLYFLHIGIGVRIIDQPAQPVPWCRDGPDRQQPMPHRPNIASKGNTQ